MGADDDDFFGMGGAEECGDGVGRPSFAFGGNGEWLDLDLIAKPNESIGDPRAGFGKLFPISDIAVGKFGTKREDISKEPLRCCCR